MITSIKQMKVGNCIVIHTTTNAYYIVEQKTIAGFSVKNIISGWTIFISNAEISMKCTIFETFGEMKNTYPEDFI